ncbi:biotin--protein ligase 2-like isoform X2 [Impatiens glandulifera]|uniref:biotin--protein ligase 2-like isoform X2 n=1 Tax=Impatiens glandulifera TaxID=253017 RepID=UPI001FB0E9A9|nr:biotin--protein ligase 2-like isoform X2 [Impatiens glandulifera]
MSFKLTRLFRFLVLRPPPIAFVGIKYPLSISLSSDYNCCNKPLSITTKVMGDSSLSAPLLVLCGKTSAEKELARSLKDNSNLKLPETPLISVMLHSEIDKPVEEDQFQIDLFLRSLSTTRFGRLLLWSPLLSSTHDVVSHNFSELPIGAVCVADFQSKGRGRSKNVWESPKGCLLFSFTMQMEDGRIVPLVQYVASLSMTEAIKDICVRNGLPNIDVRIKWPNDLYLNGLKVGGILCTSTYRSKKFNVSAGIGLNVDNKKPTTCLNSVLQELTSTSFQIRKEELLATFFNKFETLFDLFISEGFKPLEDLYYKTWLHSGQRVIVQEKEKDDDQLTEIVATIQGLTSSGYLLAVDESGQMCELHPDGNSFDFFKGLVKRKMS